MATMVSVRMTEELAGKLRAVAGAQGKTLTRVVVETLEMAMEGGLVVDTPESVGVKAKAARKVVETAKVKQAVVEAPEVEEKAETVPASGVSGEAQVCEWCGDMLVDWSSGWMHCFKCGRNARKVEL